VKVTYFGTWERGYPRNEQVISALRAVGVEVAQIHVDIWQSEHKFAPRVAAKATQLAVAELRLALAKPSPDVAALLVGYPGHFDIWSAKRHGRPVVFNAMVSLYDTLVEDRRRFAAGSLAAKALRQLDRRAFAGADILVADTRANAAYMAELAGVPEPAVCFVGAEERLFKPGWRTPERFTALFVGKLIPLHGLEVIMDAARLLPDVPFRVVGSGQLEHALRDLPPNVERVAWVEYERLPEEYANAGCALGIFGSTPKAQRVIPNKAFQALAVGAPLITADTAAARELLVPGRDALLVPPTAEALADAVSAMRADTGLAERVAREGRATFEREASEQVLGARWRALIEKVAA
jgi:glycosyltransferase involved in cell wall biosynthesis